MYDITSQGRVDIKMKNRLTQFEQKKRTLKTRGGLYEDSDFPANFDSLGWRERGIEWKRPFVISHFLL